MSVRTTTGVTAALLDMRNADKAPDVLRVIDASDVTTSEASLPWVTARLTIDAPADAVAAKLQPGQPYVLAFGTPSWYWNLVVTSYVPRTDGTVELQLASFDTRLLTYTPIAVDRSCWAMQDDVNTIWRYVVGKVFGSAPGDDGMWDIQRTDADVPKTPFRTYQPLTNLMMNGSFESGISGWTASGATIAASTAWSKYGSSSLQITPTANYSQAQVTFSSLRPSTKYTLSATLRMGAQQGSVGANARTMAVGFNLNGTQVGYALAPTAPNVAYSETRLSVTFTTPALMDSATLKLYNGGASGQPSVWWDGILLVEGDGLETDAQTPIAYFDGNTTDGANGYNYDWQGDPGTSASTRTPVTDRDPDLLTWRPGQTAYDFLEPILQTLGLRTFAYAQYEYGTPGGGSTVAIQPLLALTTYQYSRRLYYTPIPDNQYAVASGINLYDIDVQTAIGAEFADGTPMYADAVVLHYTWTDSTGKAREAYDTYSFATTFLAPYVVEYPETPFPGRGRAVNLYRRLAARRRLITVTHRLRERIEPGVLLTVTDPSLGGSGSVLGYVDSTSHDLTSGVSVTRIKDAVDYPTNAWLRQAAGKSWNAVPTGTSWNTFTP